MKRIITILISTFLSFGYAQNKIEFIEPNKKINKATDFVQLDISITDNTEKQSTQERITFDVVCKSQTTPEIDSIITYNVAKNTKSIIFVLPKKIQNQNQILDFELVNTEGSQALKIGNSSCNVVISAKETQSQKEVYYVGFKTTVEEIQIDPDLDEEIIIPLNIYSKNYAPIAADDLIIEIEISEIKDCEFLKLEKSSIPISYQNGEKSKLKLIPKNDSVTSDSIPSRIKIKDFKKDLNTLVKKGKLSIKIKNIKSKGDKIKIDNSKKEIIVIIRNVSKYSYDKVLKRKYNFHIGTNFDFQNSLEANSFYSEISVFLPNLFLHERVGLRAGIYKNSSVSILEERTTNQTILEIQDNSVTDNELTVVRKNVSRTPERSLDNLGIFAGFTVRLNNKTELSLKENFQIFAMLNFELIERRETIVFNDELLFPIETFDVTFEDLADDEELREALVPQNTTRKFYSSYYGLGFPMLYNNKYIEVFLLPIFGVGNPGYRINELSSNEISSFASAQFSLTEKKYGIKLSGDVRKYLRSGQTPIITINLSKSFDLTSLFESNK